MLSFHGVSITIYMRCDGVEHALSLTSLYIFLCSTQSPVIFSATGHGSISPPVVGVNKILVLGEIDTGFGRET